MEKFPCGLPICTWDDCLVCGKESRANEKTGLFYQFCSKECGNAVKKAYEQGHAKKVSGVYPAGRPINPKNECGFCGKADCIGRTGHLHNEFCSRACGIGVVKAYEQWCGHARQSFQLTKDPTGVATCTSTSFYKEECAKDCRETNFANFAVFDDGGDWRVMCPGCVIHETSLDDDMDRKQIDTGHSCHLCHMFITRAETKGTKDKVEGSGMYLFRVAPNDWRSFCSSCVGHLVTMQDVEEEAQMAWATLYFGGKLRDDRIPEKKEFFDAFREFVRQGGHPITSVPVCHSCRTEVTREEFVCMGCMDDLQSHVGDTDETLMPT